MDHAPGTFLARQTRLLHADTTVEEAVHALKDSRVPALPVINDREHKTGIFGEREFMIALFPGYVGELRFTGFVPHSLDDVIAHRSSCRYRPVSEYMNRDPVEVSPDVSYVQVAEIFLHHRVLIVPVTVNHKVNGVITRADFFRELTDRFLVNQGPDA